MAKRDGQSKTQMNGKLNHPMKETKGCCVELKYSPTDSRVTAQVEKESGVFALLGICSCFHSPSLSCGTHVAEPTQPEGCAYKLTETAPRSPIKEVHSK
jgi:hypothetical protein